MADTSAGAPKTGGPSCPYDAWMGFRTVRSGGGEAIVAGDVDSRFANPPGSLHGGVLAGLADSALGLAALSTMEEGQTCTNTDLHLRFYRPVWEGTMTATARMVRRGRQVLQGECEVTDGEGRRVAFATSAFLVLPGADRRRVTAPRPEGPAP